MLHVAEGIARVPYSVEHPCVVEVDGAPVRVMIAETDHCCRGFVRMDSRRLIAVSTPLTTLLSTGAAHTGHMTGLTRGLVLTAFVGVALSWAPSGQAQNRPPPPFRVTAISVVRPDAAICTYKWQATVRNDSGTTSAPTSARALEGTAAGVWQPKGGVRVDVLGLGQTGTAGPLTFERTSEKTQFKVEITSGDQIVGSMVQALPPQPPESVLSLVASASATSYVVTVKNSASEGYPAHDLGLQGWSGPTATGPWSAAGGTDIAPNERRCLRANGAYTMSTSKPSAHRFVRAQLNAGSRTVLETVIDSSRPSLSPR